VIVDPGRQKT